MNGSPYLLLERIVLWIHNGAAAAIQGVSLGFLNNAKLEQLTTKRYASSFQSYMDESYLNSGLFNWEREAIHRYFPPGGRILVAAAGAGREVIALSNAGFLVDGFDCCGPLVTAGKNELSKQGIDAVFDHARPSAVPEHKHIYDGVLVGFSGYMYIPGRSRRIRFLQDLVNTLKPDAPLMVSFTEGFPGRRRTWTAQIGTALRKLHGAEPVEEGDCFKGGYQHHFDEKQIRSEMNEVGMELAYYSGGTCYGHAVGLVRKRNDAS